MKGAAVGPDSSSPGFRSRIGRAVLIPHVGWIALRAPKDSHVGWDRYWGRIRATGVGGDVLWDAGDLDEALIYLTLSKAHLDGNLPLVDVGCGNGRFTRRFAGWFPSVSGVDVSDNAVVLATAESADLPDLSFRALDATAPDAAEKIRADIGTDANVFVRGVFHVLDAPQRVALARNLLDVVGAGGRVLLAETNYRGSQLGYLEHLGATPRRIPAALVRAIVDLPRPGRFGEPERSDTFPDSAWSVVDQGPTVIQTIPLRGTTEPERIPGYFAVMAPRV